MINIETIQNYFFFNIFYYFIFPCKKIKKKAIIILPPKFPNESGFYDNDFFLTLLSSINAEIYYTNDGTNPINSNTSIKYKDPIKIYERSGESNVYTKIGDDPESPLYIGPLIQYKKPKYLLDKAMIVRA